MAKHNQVTMNLKIAAEAQLKNSKAFMRELDKISDNFDFGDKTNQQFAKAKKDLTGFNKIIESASKKSIISDSELKKLTEASKESVSLIQKTQKIFSNFSSQDWKKVSRSYIAEAERREKEIAKIKAKYNSDTGKDYDKEIKKLDSLILKNKELKKEREKLQRLNATDVAQREIEKTTRLLEQQKQKLKEIEEIKTKSAKAYSNTLQSRSNSLNYKDFDEVKHKQGQTDRQIEYNIGRDEYNKLSAELRSIQDELKEINKEKQKGINLDEAAVAIAKKHQLQNVKNVEDLNKQIRAKKEYLKLHRGDKGFFAKNNQAQVDRDKATRDQARQDYQTIIQDARLAEAKAITANGKYKSKASLSASYGAANRNVSALEAQLTDAGINTIVTAATDRITNELRILNGKIQDSDTEIDALESVDDKVAKLTTQSERMADENDVKAGAKAQIDATNRDGQKTRDKTDSDGDATRQAIIGMRTGRAGKIAEMDTTRTAVKDFKEDLDNLNLVSQGEQISLDETAIQKRVNNLQNIIANIEKVTTFKPNAKTAPDSSVDLNYNLAKGHVKSLEVMFSDFLTTTIRDVKTEIADIDAKISEYSTKTGAPRKGRESDFEKQQSLKADKQNLLSQLETMESAYPKKTFSNLIGVTGKVIKDNTSSGTEPIPDYSGPAAEYNKTIQKSIEQTQFMGSALDDVKNKVGYFLSLNFVFDQMTAKISEAAQATKEMDKDMTQIGLVLGKTAGETWSNFNTYSKMAERLHTTTSEVTQSMKLFYQQGLNTSEVNKMVEASAIAAALGESTMAEASETLTSIINSYNLSASQAMMVTDKISQIAIVSAADFGEISIAIEKVASSAASAGLDLDHMMGYLAKMIETTREAPTNIGTALKTIVANFTQFKEDPSGLTEEGSEINKVDKALKSVNISLTDANGEVRDLGEVLDELGGRWDTLTRNQKSYLATAIAGTRQQSRFYALMNDYGRTMELVSEGTNSSGKALEQFGLYSHSLEASLKQLDNQWQKFFNSLTAGNGVMRKLADTATFFMKILNTMTPLGTATGVAVFAQQARKAVTQLQDLNSAANELSNKEPLLQQLQEIDNEIQNTKNDKRFTPEGRGKRIKQLKGEKQKLSIDNNLPDMSNIDTKQLQSIVNLKKEIEAIDTKLVGTTSFMEKLKTTSAKTWKQIQLGFKQGVAGAKSFGVALLKSTAVMAAIAISVKAITALFSAMGDGIKSALKINVDEYLEAADKANENAKNIEGLSGEYEELSNKIEKTAEDEKRLKEITEEVTEVDADLGRQLKENAGNYQANIKAMKDYAAEQKKLAGSKKADAIRGDASGWNFKNSAFLLFQSDTYRSAWGSESDKKDLKKKEFGKWQELATAKGESAGYDATQQEFLRRYTQSIIDSNNQLGATGIRLNTGEFEDIVNRFMDKLGSLTEKQTSDYKNYIDEREKGEKTYGQIAAQWADLDLPAEMKQILLEDNQNRENNLRNVINNNDAIDIKDRRDAYLTARNTMSSKAVNTLLNSDTSTLSDAEETQLNEAINVILTKDFKKANGEMISAAEAYSDSVAIGGQGVNNFAKQLVKTNQLTQEQAQLLSKVNQGMATAATLTEALGHLADYSDPKWRKGEVTQSEMLQQVIDGKFSLNDIGISTYNTTDALGGNQLSTLIVPKMDAILLKMDESVNKLVQPFTDFQTTLQSEITTMHSQSPNDIRAGKQELLNNYNKWNTATPTASVSVNKQPYQRPVAPVTSAITGVKGMGPVKKTPIPEETQKRKRSEIEEKIKKNTSTIYFKEGEKAAQEYADAFGDLSKEAMAFAKNDKKVTDSMEEQIAESKKLEEAIRGIFDPDMKPMKEFTAVFDQLELGTAVEKQADKYAQAMEIASSATTNNHDAVKALVAEYPSLLGAVDATSDGWRFNSERLQENAKAMIQNQIASIDAKIAGTEAIIGLLEGEADGYAAWEAASTSEIEGAMAYLDQYGENGEDTAADTADSLANEIQNYVSYGNQIMQVYKKIIAARNEYIRSSQKDDGVYEDNINANLSAVSLTRGSSGGEDNSGKTAEELAQIEKDKKQNAKDKLLASQNNFKGDNENSPLERYKRQLDLLKSDKSDLQKKLKNIGGWLSNLNGRGGKGGGGSKGGKEQDPYEAAVEKLEHFYNYLRQIEALEAKITKIREKRNLIDATENYYIADLAEENKLLKEQAELYGNYLSDELEYLSALRAGLAANYSDWVYFNDEGVVQVKQTEFNINSEAEEERYEQFSELLNEYETEYNTMLENQNKLYNIQATIVENINTMYDKHLQKLTDMTERLEYMNSISEHRVNMEFGSIEKLKLMSDQIKTTADMLLYAQKSVNEFEGDFNILTDTIQKSGLKSLLIWDENLQKYFVDNEKLNDPKVRAEFEAQGFNWEDVVTKVNAMAAASQKITNSLKESNEQLMSAREALKQLHEERISTIDEVFSKATEELEKFYNIYNTKIQSLGTENDLFGTKSENLDKQYDYLISVAKHSKAVIQGLKENNQNILDTLNKDYSDYVSMVDGVAYLNKVAIEESKTLTEGEKANLLELYQLYYDSKEQIDEMNDKFYEYIAQIKAMEEAKRDAIIDLKQRIHDELIARDQQEIDELAEKYQKMNALDQEYYSKLQQRISDARNARAIQQDQQDLTQMQNRLNVLQQDNSGQYNNELIELQRQINERLQAQSDRDIDLEMQRIEREQQQREEDRALQITQMENLLTFKDENGIYWQMTQDMLALNQEAIVGFLASSQEFENQSVEWQAKELESMKDLAETAAAELSTNSKFVTDDFRKSLEDFVKSPIDSIPGDIATGANQIVSQIHTATTVFINTMSGLFKYLDELTGKTDAKGYNTGIIDKDTGVYTPPQKRPPKPPAPPAPPAPANPKPALGKGAYVQVKSGARWYYDSYGMNPSGRARSGTIKYINTRGSHPYNIEGLGWIKKSDIVGYSKGGYVDYTGIAAVHGKTNKPEAFLNSRQTALFAQLRDALMNTKINSAYKTEDKDDKDNIVIENFTIDVKELADTDSIDKVVKTVKDSIYRDATSGNNMKINRRR